MSEEQKHEPINDVQQLHFELFRRVRYNLLNGEDVIRDLKEWRDLWYSVIAMRLPFPSTQKDRLPINLSLLRTTRWDSWPADTLLIWTNDANLEQLQRLIEGRWQASEVSVFVPEDEEMIYANFHDEHDRVLCVWWD
jgi:hypothetical protein